MCDLSVERSIAAHFAALNDPRCDIQRRHTLIEMIIIAIAPGAFDAPERQDPALALIAETAVFSNNPWPAMLTTLEQQPIAAVAGPGELAQTLLLCHRWALGRGLTEPLDTPLPQLIERLTTAATPNTLPNSVALR